jgi:hypothetical protein
MHDENQNVNVRYTSIKNLLHIGSLKVFALILYTNILTTRCIRFNTIAR